MLFILHNKIKDANVVITPKLRGLKMLAVGGECGDGGPLGEIGE